VSTMEDERKRVIAEAKAHIDGSWTPERFPTRATPQVSSPEQRRDQLDGLTYKVTENALAEPAELLDQPQVSDPWNEWLDRRLEEERVVVIDAVVEIVGEVVAKLRSEYQRDSGRDTEISAEFVKIWKSIEAATRSIVEIRREQVERSFHAADVGANGTKKPN